jgi:hypothetical protein
MMALEVVDDDRVRDYLGVWVDFFFLQERHNRIRVVRGVLAMGASMSKSVCD